VINQLGWTTRIIVVDSTIAQRACNVVCVINRLPYKQSS